MPFRRGGTTTLTVPPPFPLYTLYRAGTKYRAGHYINALERRGIEGIQVLLNNVPCGTVQPKGRASVLVDFDQSRVFEPSLF